MALSRLPDDAGDGDDGDEVEPGILSEINITPLTDVFLVLLIIFMVATSAAVDAAHERAEQAEERVVQGADGARDEGSAGMEINLPRASTTAVLSAPAEIDIWVGKDGALRVHDEAVDVAGLKQRLRVAGAADPDTLVVLRADADIPHGRVVSLMDLVRREGLTHLAVATVTAGAPGE